MTSHNIFIRIDVTTTGVSIDPSIDNNGDTLNLDDYDEMVKILLLYDENEISHLECPDINDDEDDSETLKTDDIESNDEDEEATQISKISRLK